MKKNSVRTPTGGASEILDDGSMMVEETDYGRILFFNNTGDLEWEFVNKDDNDNIYIIQFSRIIKNKQLIESIRQTIQNTKCIN